jgi:tricorn protease
VAAGSYDKLRAVSDGVVWLELPRAGELGETVLGAAEAYPQSRLVRYDLAHCSRSVEVEDLDDYAVSGDGSRLAYRRAESVEIKPTGLDEAVTDMAGIDWAAMADRYRPLLDRIGSTDELHDVLWELQGEVGSSHAGLLPPAAGGDPALAQGLLGADVERTADGTWRIARILPASRR